ncbi:MAG: nitronate monooxygenase [Acidimicrobiia bacterium]
MIDAPETVSVSREIDEFPEIIQGGMGIAISGYKLANAVGKAGQMGVVSGTVIDVVHARKLQNGDTNGDLRRAYSHFPIPEIAQRVLDQYFVEGGKEPSKPYKNVPAWSVDPPRDLIELCIVANFAEVFLAKEGHGNPIGINYLEKIQLPVVASTLGAMLAGVDAILMGAGIPKQMPKLIRDLASNKCGTYKIDVEGSLPGEVYSISLDPQEILGSKIPLKAPRFLAIISSNTLANFLKKDPGSRPDGFIVELPSAGGHNSPPRGVLQLDDNGQPVYGERDYPHFETLAELQIPFWIAGSWAKPNKLQEARVLGARGIQVGTAFAFSDESGFDIKIKRLVFEQVRLGNAKVFTDPVASPSGFPFKVVQLPGTISELEIYQSRRRVCDLSYLRSYYRQEDGTVGYRCSAEPVDAFVRKGGTVEGAQGKKCLCNALMGNIGLGQVRRGVEELPLVTSGDDLTEMITTIGGVNGRYSAKDVIDYILNGN